MNANSPMFSQLERVHGLVKKLEDEGHNVTDVLFSKNLDAEIYLAPETNLIPETQDPGWNYLSLQDASLRWPRRPL